MMQRMARRQLWIATTAGALVLIIGLLAACGRTTGAETAANVAAPAAPAATQTVTILNLAFTPSSLTINVGDTVTWKNAETLTTHTVTSDTGSAISFDQMLAPGDTFSFHFTQAGTIHYHCNIHPFMHGTITVSAPATPTPTATATTGLTPTVGHTPTADPTASPKPTPTSPPQGK